MEIALSDSGAGEAKCAAQSGGWGDGGHEPRGSQPSKIKAKPSGRSTLIHGAVNSSIITFMSDNYVQSSPSQMKSSRRHNSGAAHERDLSDRCYTEE